MQAICYNCMTLKVYLFLRVGIKSNIGRNINVVPSNWMFRKA